VNGGHAQNEQDEQQQFPEYESFPFGEQKTVPSS
jgi:hypothetical protein